MDRLLKIIPSVLDSTLGIHPRGGGFGICWGWGSKSQYLEFTRYSQWSQSICEVPVMKTLRLRC